MASKKQGKDPEPTCQCYSTIKSIKLGMYYKQIENKYGIAISFPLPVDIYLGWIGAIKAVLCWALLKGAS